MQRPLVLYAEWAHANTIFPADNLDRLHMAEVNTSTGFPSARSQLDSGSARAAETPSSFGRFVEH